MNKVFSIGSSPHERGSSVRRQRHQLGDCVVPARAGVFRTIEVPRHHLRRRPRTSGGLPLPWCRSPGRHRSSPHERGSSVRARAPCLDQLVVPARAGVFPTRTPRARRSAGRPRTSGGLPFDPAERGTCHGSSPHERGSSGAIGRPNLAEAVVPARAGVFPTRRWAAERCARRPRTSGGLPNVMFDVLTGQPSSPHERGSSYVRAPRGRREVVVPARAGVFLAIWLLTHAWRGRPRTSGGLPPTADWNAVPVVSSPHERGSSMVPRHSSAGSAVVPARAGVFRAWRL